MAFLKTTSGQWCALVSIVLLSAVLMYFTFSQNTDGFRGMTPMVKVQPFNNPDVYPVVKSNLHYSQYNRN